MSRFLPASVSLCALLAGSACATEPPRRPDPVFSSAPGVVVESDPVAPITREEEAARMNAQGAKVGPAVQRKVEKPVVEKISLLPPQDYAPAEARFAASYKAKARPTVAVFFNRQLSDEVREWVEPRRTVTLTEIQERWFLGTRVGKDEATATYQTSPEQNPLTESRRKLDERQAWIVEDAFQAPLLKQGTRLVDRATMMRLAAFKSGKQDNPDATIALKHLEMGALLGHADYFVELLVSNRPDSKLGYELRAQVKEVKTGIIVASATTATWRFAELPAPANKTRKVPVATDQGYVYREEKLPEPTVIIPFDVEVAERLAHQVMEQLATSWDAT